MEQVAFEEVLARHQKDDAVFFMGDVHRHGHWTKKQIERVAEAGASLILQVGDFGILPGSLGKKFLLEVDDTCEKYGVDIFVTLGNHEEHSRFDLLWANPKRHNESGPMPLNLRTRHIWVLPRPYRFVLNGVSFTSLGGAASVDFDHRTLDRDWWPTEALTREQVDKAIAFGHSDVLILHETPNEPYVTPGVRSVLLRNPMGFSEAGLAYSARSRLLATQAVEGINPLIVAHGHMHVASESVVYGDDAFHPTHTWSLDSEYTNGNLRRLELADFSDRYM